MKYLLIPFLFLSAYSFGQCTNGYNPQGGKQCFPADVEFLDTVRIPAGAGLGYIWTSDAAGNATWQTPGSVISNTAWLLTGNTGTNSGTNFLGTMDDASLNIVTNGVQRAYIDSATGNVGLGNSNPPARLFIPELSEPFRAQWRNNSIEGLTGDWGLGDAYGGFGWNIFDSINGVQTSFNTSQIGFGWFIVNPSATGNFRYDVNEAGAGYTLNETILGFWQDTTNMNVGIGTAAPAYKLEVNGDLYAAINNQSGKFHQLVYFDANPFEKGSVYVDEAGLILTMTNAAGQNANIIQLSDGSLDIASNNDNGDITIHTTSADNVIIQGDDGVTNGFVGIGTNSPSGKLHVNGTVRFEGLPQNTSNSDTLIVIDDAGNAGWKISNGQRVVYDSLTALTGETVVLENNTFQIIASSAGVADLTIDFPQGKTGDEINVKLQYGVVVLSYSGVNVGTIQPPNVAQLQNYTFKNFDGNWY